MAITREDLFDALKFDRLKPDEAEAEATRLGLNPLAPLPDVGAFDPMAEQYWTLPMAMMWIATRSVDAVRMAWNKYRQQHPIWRRTDWRNGPGGEIHKGWLLDSLSPATSLGLQLYEIVGRYEGRDGIMSVADARKALWIGLQEGLFPATGISRAEGGRVPVPAQEWHNLEPRSFEHKDEVGRQGGVLSYSEPLVPAMAIWHLWSTKREPTKVPLLMRPDGDGWMPIYCAAQWVASKGGAVDIIAEDQKVWRDTFDELLAAISSDKVRVVGLKGGQRELVPGHTFAGCRVDYPHSDAALDLIFSNDLYLRSFPYISEARWREGFDDALVSRRGEHWIQLMVEKGDIRKRWAFEPEPTSLSGFPGRPTSKQLVMAELERRSEDGEMLQTVTDEATALSKWLSDTHPQNPAAKQKTVENQIRDRYRALRAPK